MKSGNIRSVIYKLNIDLERQYEGLHLVPECKGKWQITVTMGASVRFTVDAIGPVHVPAIPLATCHICKTSYELPGFRQFIERAIAEHLVKTKELLTKKQIHFLRLYFDKTQEEFAKQIGLANRQEMSRIESEDSERRLDTDRQVRLKLYCAELLNIKDLNIVYGTNRIDDSKMASIPLTIFPETESEIEKIVQDALKSA